MDYVRLSRNLYVHYVRLSTSFFHCMWTPKDFYSGLAFPCNDVNPMQWLWCSMYDEIFATLATKISWNYFGGEQILTSRLPACHNLCQPDYGYHCDDDEDDNNDDIFDSLILARPSRVCRRTYSLLPAIVWSVNDKVDFALIIMMMRMMMMITIVWSANAKWTLLWLWWQLSSRKYVKVSGKITTGCYFHTTLILDCQV